ncbi:Hsp20/alpha crystallin family protein [Halapricum hydrolyticum]|uniref:Hsp20/alpha crystallin family protein n=1 Tax=Halapricum hydrolyticum TaxID=2979991 RepID=A0AAE3LIV6_9EURY|nr:Hsp20/alpha crystallin family protein [Halapricum hydrolyticum]MCU4717544.1 Hsp20/alpha crystallin family protein [Halapricum hydrolyticum]MCU4726708.1 Hsp20/alpha crystallin family protein [Halapricum hydrolyticum]
MTSLRDVGKTISNAVLESVGRAMGRAQEQTPLPVDLLESDEAYLAVFDAPGATSSDMQVRLSGRTVEVRIDRFRDVYEGFEMVLPGRGLSLDGAVTLPEDAAIEPEAATATLHDNGTLRVTVPKGEEEPDVEADEETESETGEETEADEETESETDEE